jgi:hypothetical protein
MSKGLVFTRRELEGFNLVLDEHLAAFRLLSAVQDEVIVECALPGIGELSLAIRRIAGRLTSWVRPPLDATVVYFRADSSGESLAVDAIQAGRMSRAWAWIRPASDGWIDVRIEIPVFGVVRMGIQPRLSRAAFSVDCDRRIAVWRDELSRGRVGGARIA